MWALLQRDGYFGGVVLESTGYGIVIECSIG